VAERAGSIALQTHQQIVGVVENMSWMELPDGSRMELFGAGGGQAVADSLAALTGTKVPLMGQVPIDQRVREGGDDGVPIVLSDPDSPAAQVYRAVADALAARQTSLVGRSLGLSPVRG
jgi:ATP-binding protein involved in chromosome partitioning